MADVVVVPSAVRAYPETSGNPTSAPFLENAGEELTAGLGCYYDEDLRLWFAGHCDTALRANFGAMSVTGAGANGKVGLIRPSFTPYVSKIYLGVALIEGMVYILSPNGSGKICPITDMYVLNDDPDYAGLYVTPVGIGDADDNLCLLNGYSGIEYTLGLGTPTTTTTTP